MALISTQSSYSRELAWSWNRTVVFEHSCDWQPLHCIDKMFWLPLCLTPMCFNEQGMMLWLQTINKENVGLIPRLSTDDLLLKFRMLPFTYTIIVLYVPGSQSLHRPAIWHFKSLNTLFSYRIVM